MRTIKRTTAMLMMLLAAACGDSTGPSGETHLGVYTLRTINTQALPITVEAGVALTSGSITISSNDTYTVRLDLQVGASNMSDSFDGTYTRSGTTIMLEDGVTGAFSGDNTLTVTFPDDGSVWVFRK